MKTKLVRIGNSRGVRIPERLLRTYGLRDGSGLDIEERREGLLLRVRARRTELLTWAEAYREIARTRPAVAVSDNAMNEHLGTVVVCPITSRLHPRWPSRIQATVGGRRAEIAVDQIRTVARERLGKRMGKLSEVTAAGVRHLITLMYGVLSGGFPT